MRRRVRSSTEKPGDDDRATMRPFSCRARQLEIDQLRKVHRTLNPMEVEGCVGSAAEEARQSLPPHGEASDCGAHSVWQQRAFRTHLLLLARRAHPRLLHTLAMIAALRRARRSLWSMPKMPSCQSLSARDHRLLEECYVGGLGGPLVFLRHLPTTMSLCAPQP